MKLYKMPHRVEFEVRNVLDEWCKKNKIESSQCVDHCLPLVCTRKANGKIRVCLDCRFVNENIDKTQINTEEFGNLPNIKNILKEVSKYKYYTKLDLKDGYCHLEIAEKGRDFLTFMFQGKKYRFGGVHLV